MKHAPTAIACTLAPFILSLGLAAAPAQAADYTQAPGSTLAFGGTFQGEPFAGRFPDFHSTLSFDPANLAQARLQVEIELSSATTANADYDTELRGASFLDSARFPTARYTATSFRHVGGDRYNAQGTLSLHGVEQPVALEFTWTPGPQPLLAGKATVRRLAFGIGTGDWADTSLIPDPIAISTRVRFNPR